MHGQQNIKICNAEQAKHLYRYKNIETKLYKCIAAIWYNKTCRIQFRPPDDGPVRPETCRGKRIADIVRRRKNNVSSWK